MSPPKLVLSVDDDLFLRNSAGVYFEGSGFEVALAEGEYWLENPILGANTIDASQQRAAD